MATDQHGAPDQHNLPGQQRRILGVDIDALTLDQTVQRCLAAIDSEFTRQAPRIGRRICRQGGPQAIGFARNDGDGQGRPPAQKAASHTP